MVTFHTYIYILRFFNQRCCQSSTPLFIFASVHFSLWFSLYYSAFYCFLCTAPRNVTIHVWHQTFSYCNIVSSKNTVVTSTADVKDYVGMRIESLTEVCWPNVIGFPHSMSVCGSPALLTQQMDDFLTRVSVSHEN